MKANPPDETLSAPDAIPAPPADRNLSTEIEQALAREPGDRIRCMRIYNDYYRCNWWSPVGVDPGRNQSHYWGVLTTHRVRKSRFVTAKITDGRLVITDVERVAPSN